MTDDIMTRGKKNDSFITGAHVIILMQLYIPGSSTSVLQYVTKYCLLPHAHTMNISRINKDSNCVFFLRYSVIFHLAAL